jgi:excisionase family DNA binding protein
MAFTATTRDVARAFGVSAGTVREWAARGFIPWARMGERGRLRFDLAGVRAALNQRRQVRQKATPAGTTC